MERKNMKILALLRAQQFSPNSVANDRAILMAVVERLRALGHHVDVEQEENISQAAFEQAHGQRISSYSLCLSMGRLPSTLAWLKELQRQGVNVVNTPEAVNLCCNRNALTRVMMDNAIPVPPSIVCSAAVAHDRSLYGAGFPCWLKRGDACAQSGGDVVFCEDENHLEMQIQTFRDRGIDHFLVSRHFEGDLIKFYGVGGTGFFRYYYPTDDHLTKYNDERHNGHAHHYHFNAAGLQADVERLSSVVGIGVYGGDAIVGPDGAWHFIDFNDWPSFSRCREEAAEKIVQFIIHN